MEEKGVRVSDDAHQRLVNYVVENPVFKMNKVADIAIKSWLDLPSKAKVISIIKHGENRDHG